MGTITPVQERARPGITAPAPLTSEHEVQEFRCGKPALDDWLRYRAIKAEGHSARTYVTCVGQTVVGYYCFAVGAVRRDEMPKRLRRNMPDVVPLTVLGRLAVDQRFHGLNIGKGMLRDGISRALHASKVIGSRAILVHAIDEDAIGFYAQFGFVQFPGGSQTLFLPMETVEQILR